MQKLYAAKIKGIASIANLKNHRTKPKLSTTVPFSLAAEFLFNYKTKSKSYLNIKYTLATESIYKLLLGLQNIKESYKHGNDQANSVVMLYE